MNRQEKKQCKLNKNREREREREKTGDKLKKNKSSDVIEMCARLVILIF